MPACFCTKPIIPAATSRLSTRRFVFIALGILLGLALAGVGRAENASDGGKWRHYQSPHFEMYATARESEARALLRDLEVMRAVFLDRFKVVERTRLDLTVFLFGTERDFLSYAPGASADSHLSAFYAPYPDRAILGVGPAGPEMEITNGAVSKETYFRPRQCQIFHEYIHHLFRSTNQQPTLWYAEGMAEVLAGAQILPDRVELGNMSTPTFLYIAQRQLLPLSALFTAEKGRPMDRDHRQPPMFVAESWALLHFLLFGQAGFPPAGVDRFMLAMSNRPRSTGLDLPSFFRECFGIDYAEMESRLSDYIARRKYRINILPLPKFPAESTYAVREVAPDEVKLRLAELEYRAKQSGQAKLALLEAKSSDDPRVHEVLGSAALVENDPTEAQARWTRALELGSTTPGVVRQLDYLEMQQWIQRATYDFRLPPEVTDRLRKRLLESIQRDPEQTEAYENLAFVEAFAPEPSMQNEEMIQLRFRQLTSKARVVAAFAMFRSRMNQPAEAMALLSQLSRLPQDSTAKSLAEMVRAHLNATAPTHSKGAAK